MKKKKLIIMLITILLLTLPNLVNAETRNVFDYNTKVRYYPANTLDRIYLNNNYTLPSGQSLYGIEFDLDTNGQDSFIAGQYLFDFQVVSNQLNTDLGGCKNIVSDFKLYDLTQSRWVSSSSQSKSQCIGSYYSNVNGIKSIHYLFSWTTNNSSGLDILWTRSQLFIYNTGLFVNSGGNYSVVLGNLQDYDSKIVSDFNSIVINQQNTQDIINNQNQNSQAEQNAINNQTAAITNDNVDAADSKASEWASKSLSDNAVANMVTMPITLLQAYLNGLNGTCSSFSLGTLYNHELTLPCIDLSSYFGSNLWSVIDILFSGFMIYALGKKFVKIFNDFTNLRDNQVDELYGGGN